MKNKYKGLKNRLKIGIKKSIIWSIGGLSRLLSICAEILQVKASSLEDVVDGTCRPVSSSGCEKLFTGWLNNRMSILLMLIQHPKAREERVRQRILNFLEDLRHHFLPSIIKDSESEAFDYLASYFQAYPAVSREQGAVAKVMVNRVYRALGYPSKVTEEETAEARYVLSQSKRGSLSMNEVAFVWQEIQSTKLAG